MTGKQKPDPVVGAATPSAPSAFDARVLGLMHRWLDGLRETDSARAEAELDRAVFESFPASDPVAPAQSSERETSVVEVDCELSATALTFTHARASPAASVPVGREPVIESAMPGGYTVRIRMREPGPDAGGEPPSTLDLPPEHASIRPRQHERRSGRDRRTTGGSPPSGPERRGGGERRAAG